MSVYSFGSGKEGQLGQCTTNADQLDPAVVSALKGKRITKVSCGESHSLAITEWGDVYSWGRGREGQLGQGDRQNSNTPALIKALAHERVIQAQCGSYHSIALTDTGKVYIWGKINRVDINSESNQYYRGVAQDLPGMQRNLDRVQASVKAYLAAGLNQETLDQAQVGMEFEKFVNVFQTLPLLVEGGLSGRRVVQIGAGYGYNAAVTDTGLVFTWGFNEKGQLGLGHRFNQESPAHVAALSKEDIRIVQVACGSQHTLFLSDKGEIYSCGLGVFGQLGHGDLDDLLYPKALHKAFERWGPVLQIACGAYFSTGRTQSGEVLSWGHGEYGQHGGDANYQDWRGGGQAGSNGKDSNLQQAMPQRVGGFQGQRVVFVACGQLHSVVITEDRGLYTWGWGSSGCLGHGDKRFQLVPRLVTSLQGEDIAHASCGWKHTLVVKAGDMTTFAFDFRPLLNDTKYSDLTFIVQGKPIHAHKVVVMARCAFLRSQLLLEARFCNQGHIPNEIVVKGVRYPIFTSLLLYLYTDHLILPPHLGHELGKLAQAYGLTRLEALCSRLALKSISAYKEPIASDVVIIPSSTLSVDMKDIVGVKAFCSREQLILFDVGGTHIYAHKAVLAARCKYFERMFEGGFRERDQQTFVIDDGTEPASFHSMLDFLYSGDASVIQSHNAVDLLGLADRFMVEDLKQLCESYLEALVSDTVTAINKAKELAADLLASSELVENFEMTTSLYEVGDRYHAQRLKRVCLDTMCGMGSWNWRVASTTPRFSELTEHAPHLREELNRRAAANGLAALPTTHLVA
eukprot:TRINITY_DN1847_c0_g1_i2.p1 TRINITY_DN1847_c0_g1~~TRINITY_DN1847_c0_g1_i2.p1  ORF type:complete len:799 (-),score=177.11 TRINITY_DN1847_c0_g1_i2:50-2446(-)